MPSSVWLPAIIQTRASFPPKFEYEEDEDRWKKKTQRCRLALFQKAYAVVPGTVALAVGGGGGGGGGGDDVVGDDPGDLDVDVGDPFPLGMLAVALAVGDDDDVGGGGGDDVGGDDVVGDDPGDLDVVVDDPERPLAALFTHFLNREST